MYLNFSPVANESEKCLLMIDFYEVSVCFLFVTDKHNETLYEIQSINVLPDGTMLLPASVMSL